METTDPELAEKNLAGGSGMSPAAGDVYGRRRWCLWLVLILLFQAGASFPFLGAVRLGSHEQLAAERAREMMDLGHWVIPHLNGEPNLFKPPLPFWLVDLLAVATGGEVNEFVARVPSVLTALGLTVVIAVLARSMTSPGAALLAAFMHASSVTALVWGRRAEVDIQLAFWTALMLCFYWFALVARRPQAVAVRADSQNPDTPAAEDRADRPGRAFGFALLGWLAMTIAVMTKGPLPVIQLAVVVLVVGIAMKRWPGKVALWALAPGVLIFLACSLPWLIAVYRRFPNVFQVWHDQTIGRMFSDDMESGHPKPVFFYLLRVWGLVLPWIVPLAVGLWHGFKGRLNVSRRAWIFLLAWSLGSLVFMSLVAGKRVRYALVFVGPFFVIAAMGMDYLWTHRRRYGRWLALGVKAHLVLVPAAVIGAVVVAILYPVTIPAMIILGLVVPVGLLASYTYFTRDRIYACLTALAVTLLAVMPVVSAMVAPHLENLSKNTGPVIGRYIADHGIDPAEVCLYRTTNHGIVFYAGSPLRQIDTPEELAAWRDEHPSGYVIIRDDRGLDEIEATGPCEPVDFFDGAVRPKKIRYFLWKLADEGVIQESPVAEE